MESCSSSSPLRAWGIDQRWGQFAHQNVASHWSSRPDTTVITAWDQPHGMAVLFTTTDRSLVAAIEQRMFRGGEAGRAESKICLSAGEGKVAVRWMVLSF